MHMKAFMTFVHAALDGTTRLKCPFFEPENIVGIFFSKIGIHCSLKVKAFGKLKTNKKVLTSCFNACWPKLVSMSWLAG